MMEIKAVCPICHHQANCQIYSTEWGVEEEYTNCPVCGFRQEFAYGGYFETVGNQWFIWNYTLSDNNDKFIRLMKKISKAEFMGKRNWKKFRKRTVIKCCPW